MNLVYNTISANGADVSINGKIITVLNSADGTSATFNVANLPSVIRRQRRVTGISRVVTLTPTASVSRTYTLKLRATNVLDGGYQNFIYNYVSDSVTAPTATQIVTAFKTAINGDLRIPVTASGTATLILTGDVGYWDFGVQSTGTGVFTATVDGASVTSGWINNTTQVATLTPTAADSTMFGVTIVADNLITGVAQDTFVFEVNSGASATATTISAQFIAAINANPAISVTASGTATLILTSDSQAKAFTATSTGVGTIAVAATTPTNAAVIGQGLGSYLINSQFNDSNFVAGTSYTSFFVPIETEKAVGGNDLKKQTTLLAIFVNEAATNYESFAGQFGTLTQALSGAQATWGAGNGGTVVVTTATGAVALTGTSFTTENLRVGDVIFVTDAALYPITVITSQTAGFSSKLGALSSGTLSKVQIRRI
jgi:hypothetical protein